MRATRSGDRSCSFCRCDQASHPPHGDDQRRQARRRVGLEHEDSQEHGADQPGQADPHPHQGLPDALERPSHRGRPPGEHHQRRDRRDPEEHDKHQRRPRGSGLVGTPWFVVLARPGIVTNRGVIDPLAQPPDLGLDRPPLHADVGEDRDRPLELLHRLVATSQVMEDLGELVPQRRLAVTVSDRHAHLQRILEPRLRPWEIARHALDASEPVGRRHLGGGVTELGRPARSSW